VTWKVGSFGRKQRTSLWTTSERARAIAAWRASESGKLNDTRGARGRFGGRLTACGEDSMVLCWSCEMFKMLCFFLPLLLSDIFDSGNWISTTNRAAWRYFCAPSEPSSAMMDSDPAEPSTTCN